MQGIVKRGDGAGTLQTCFLPSVLSFKSKEPNIDSLPISDPPSHLPK